MKAIDFATLRRQERQRVARSQKEHSKESHQPAVATAAAGDNTTRTGPFNVDPQPRWLPSWHDTCGLGEQLLRQQPLNASSHDCLVDFNPHRIWYRANILLPHQQVALMDWLLQWPDAVEDRTNVVHTGTTMAATAQEVEAAQAAAAQGRWTTLPHTRRRVALFSIMDQSQKHIMVNGNITETQKATIAKTTKSVASAPQSATCRQEFPEPLQSIVHALIHSWHVFDDVQPPNHVLVNEYTSSQGILAHTDGPAYLDRTATISLGRDAVIHFTPIVQHEKEMHVATAPTTSTPTTHQIWLKPCSLLVFEGEAYRDYTHAIHDHEQHQQQFHAHSSYNNSAGQREGDTDQTPAAPVDHPVRISLTFRHKYPTW